MIGENDRDSVLLSLVFQTEILPEKTRGFSKLQVIYIYPYTQHPGRDTYNNDSSVYTADNQLVLAGSYTAGYQSVIHVTIPLGGSTSNYILGDATNTGNGASGGSGNGGGGTTPVTTSTASTNGGGGPGGNTGGGNTQGCAPGGGGMGGGPGNTTCVSSSVSSSAKASSSVTSARVASSSAIASSASAPTANASTTSSTGNLCLILYALPGTVDYPWSSATSLSFTYNPAPVTLSAGQAVALLSGSGSRTFTNRFGSSFTSSLTLAAAGQPSMLYLNSEVPFDTTGLTWTLRSPIQLPGNGPSTLYSQLSVYNSSGQVVEGGSSIVDGLGQSYLSSVPGFANVTIGASNINSLAVNYSACQAPITFTNGLRVPTQPSASNGAVHFSYAYHISDGNTYSVAANLSITVTSAFASTQDSLGNPYQTIVNITGSRLYTYIPTGASLTSAVTGVVSSTVSSAPVPSLRFYPYTLLSSAAGVYSINTAPFVDGDGIAFSLSPSIPANGNAPGSGTQYSSTTLRIVANSLTTAVLTEAAYAATPNITLQSQTYTLLA